MFRIFTTKTLLLFLIAAILGAASSLTSRFTYDLDGRIATALYQPDGRCHAYSYDGSGNRTSVARLAQSPQVPAWGSSNWGCVNWQP